MSIGTREAIYKLLEDRVHRDCTISDEMDLSYLGLDSFDVIEMMMELEEVLNIFIDDDMACKCETVGDLISFANALVSKQK